MSPLRWAGTPRTAQRKGHPAAPSRPATADVPAPEEEHSPA